MNVAAPTLPSFGKRLKRLRMAVGMKQDALATALKVNQTSVSRWESGAQVPDAELQQRAMACLAATRTDDSALKRLVENTSLCVHLVDEARHICLAYSKSRAEEWRATESALLGVPLWQFATDEIRAAESELEANGWWDELMPQPTTLATSAAVYPQLRIRAGAMIWERIYLADGTPARLVTSI